MKPPLFINPYVVIGMTWPKKNVDYPGVRLWDAQKVKVHIAEIHWFMWK